MWNKRFSLLPSALGALLLLMTVAADAARAPSAAGFVAPCGGTPNCVSSRDPADGSFVRPLSFDGLPEVAWHDLQRALLEEARTVVTARAQFALRAESSSLVFGFVDDLEFQLLPAEGIIEVRSASRSGFWDLGVNRRRIERIRERFNALMARH